MMKLFLCKSTFSFLYSGVKSKNFLVMMDRLEKTSQTHTSHLIHLRLAKFYASPRLKDYEKAMEHATLAVKLNPNDPLAQAALADLNKWVNDEEDEENVEGEEDDEGEVDEEEGVEVEMEGDEMEAEVDS